MSAIQAGIFAFNERALIPTEQYDWDEYQSRLFRYALSEGYYNNIAYRNIATYSQRLKFNSDLYKYIRGIYNPVYRLVESYVAKVYGGALDFEDMSGGAIPLLMASDPLKQSIRQLWLNSNWRIQKGLYVREGAQLGDGFIKLVDDVDAEKVRMEVLHPAKVKDTELDPVGNIKKAVIEYERQDPVTLRWFKYTETIDQELFTFERDGKEYDRFPNLYGFVPLVHVKHKDVGMRWGANAFHGQLAKINEVNDSSSMVGDQIRKAVNVQWWAAGVAKASEINAAADKNTLPSTTDGLIHARDKQNIMYAPKDSSITAMVANIDITAAGANIDRILLELERDMPELALHRVRESGNLTAPGVRSGYSDAIDRFVEAQGNYDDGIIRAQKMGVSIGGFRGYEGFQSFNLESFDKGDLEHFIKDRPVIEDELSKIERINALQAAGGSIELIMQEMDFDDKTIAEEVTRKEQAQRDAVRAFADGTFGEDEEDDDESTDAETKADKEAAQPVAA